MTRTSGRAIGYVRVSTEAQADSGLGLEAQEAAVETSAARLGRELVRVFVDAGTSGKLAIEDRPVLLDAAAVIKRGDVRLVEARNPWRRPPQFRPSSLGVSMAPTIKRRGHQTLDSAMPTKTARRPSMAITSTLWSICRRSLPRSVSSNN